MNSPRATSPVQFELRDLFILAVGLSISGATLRVEGLGFPVAVVGMCVSAMYFLLRLKITSPNLQSANHVLVIVLILPATLNWIETNRKFGELAVMAAWAVLPYILGMYLRMAKRFSKRDLLVGAVVLQPVAVFMAPQFVFVVGLVVANVVGFFVYLPFLVGFMLGDVILVDDHSPSEKKCESSRGEPSNEPPIEDFLQ